MNLAISVLENDELLSQQAAERLLSALRKKPNLLLCAASGSTPTRMYQLLAQAAANDPANFRAVRLVKLDEWGGIPMNDPGSCEEYLQNSLVRPLGIDSARYFGFASDSTRPEEECGRIEKRLNAEGPIDFCVLGLGLNGHIAFNEPNQALKPGAHLAQLSSLSLQHSMLARSTTLPTYGLTLGMAEILGSREILLLVSGSKKTTALKQLLTREITTEFPASFLWLHSNWSLLCDREAAGGLSGLSA